MPGPDIKEDNTMAVTLTQAQSVAEFSPSNDNWLMWKERLEIHFAEINCKEENKKKATLLKAIGSEAYSMLHCLCNPTSPVDKSYKDLCELLKTQYTPQTIVFKERRSFHQSACHEHESISSWYARVKKLAMNCCFGDNLEAFLLNQFVMGLPKKMFERICEEDETLTLASAYKKALIFETKMNLSRDASEKEINYMKSKNNNEGQQRCNGKKNNYNSSSSNKGGSGNSGRSSGSSSGRNSGSTNTKAACSHCGWRNHDSNACKYKSNKCHCCGKVGHLASVCRFKSQKNISYVSDSDNNCKNFDCNFSIFSIFNKNSMSLYTLPVMIEGVHLNAVCDTGAPCNLLPKSFLEEGKIKRRLEKCQTNYVSYSGDKIKILGEFCANFVYKGVEKNIVVVVADTNNPPLLGRTFLREFTFDLVQTDTVNQIAKIANNQIDNLNLMVDEIKNQYCEMFNKQLGTYKCAEISLLVSEDIKPIFFKPRPLPLAWKNKVENQLKQLIEGGILEPVDHSEWGTPLVPILKPNGELRLCGDYKVTINKYLIDFQYPLPRIDEIFASLQGGCLFTKLDLANAYNQLVLTEESQFLCTWSTHIGTFKMKRLPFGIKTAAAIFQKTIESLLREIPGVVVYQDDITVTGKDLNDHIKNLKLVLNKLQSAGLKLNAHKCRFFQHQISYLGFTIDANGLTKNEERTSAISNAPTPKNVPELRALIGMLNYYSKFIKNFAKKMVPLYNLLKKGVKFEWSKSCEEAYEILKKDVTSEQILVHFNPNLPIVLTTDASNTAVAGVLSHICPNNETKPIAFVSRALSKTEMNYSTLEKEALAIIFCAIKLKQYLLGHRFVLRTDHKPLLTIFGEHKGLPMMASARMQRWALILSGFNYSVEHVKGSLNDADNLSRMPQHITSEDCTEINYVNLVENENYLNIDFRDIARETRRDPVLSKVAIAIDSGQLHSLKGDEYAAFREKSTELSVEYGCVMWGYRTVVPTKLRESILQNLHSSHFGIVKTKALARSYVWWPGISKHIEDLVRNCKSCQELQASPEKSILFPWTPTYSVWSRVHIDFAGPIKGQYLFVVIDSFSKWIEVFLTKEITSSFVIKAMRTLFCRYGLVDVVVTDNGRQFTSGEFRNFLTGNKVKHILTAPGHPSTNGQAENSVKTVKKSIIANLKQQREADLHTILNRFLIDYRNTEHCSTKESPAKLFLGRNLKTRFSSLKPPLVRESLLASQDKSIKNHKGRRNVQFEQGQNILIRDYRDPNKPSWSSATVKKQIGTQSYLCTLTDTNREIKRHLDQMRDLGGSTSNNNNDNDFQESSDRIAEMKAEESFGGDEQGVTDHACSSKSREVDEEPSVRQLRPRIEGKVIKSNK